MNPSTLVDIFWSPPFWFGETNISWNDFVHVNTSSYEVIYPIVAGLLLLITRGTISTYIIRLLKPFSTRGNIIQSSRYKDLEKIFNAEKSADKEQMIKAATQTGISEREAESFIRTYPNLPKRLGMFQMAIT